MLGRNAFILTGVSVLALVVLPAAAAAEEVKPAKSQNVAESEIIVTANKREQSIRDVGMTIQAATAETLSSRGIESLSDLGKLVSGFTYTESLYTTPVYTLRGIGLYDATFGAVPAVAVYTDQVPRNFPVMSDALDLDLERIEVLKGPQGTLFGQSATGGAVNYITAKPTNRLQAGVDASFESFNKAKLSAFVSGPISSTLKGRIAVRAIEGGDWQHSISRPNDKNGNVSRIEGRGSLDWTPTPSVRLQASLTGALDKSDNQAPQYIKTDLNVYSSAALAAANANPATANPFGVVNNALYAGLTTPGSPNFDASFLSRQSTLVGRMNSTDPLLVAENYPFFSRAILGTPAQPNSSRAAEWTPGTQGPSDNKYIQASLRGDIDITDNIALTFISAYARKTLKYTIDLDGTVAVLQNIPLTGRVRTFNQEVRLSGKSDAFRWMIGLNYDNAKTFQENDFATLHYAANDPLGTGDPSQFIHTNRNTFKSKLETYGAFANAEYKITPSLKLNGGIRYTKNKQSASYCYHDPGEKVGVPGNVPATTAALFNILQLILNPPGTVFPFIRPNDCFPLGDGLKGTTKNIAIINPFVDSLTESNVSFRVGLDYKLAGGALLYATVSQGYKAGLFSAIGAANIGQYTPAVQEKVLAYEAGFKAPILDGAVDLNGAAFYYDYSNKQVRARVLDSLFGLLEKLLNVPKSYVWGLEADVRVRPVHGLTLTGSGTYLKSKVTSSFSKTPDGLAVYNTGGYTGDFKGSELPYTPKFSANADIDYRWSMGRLAPFVGGGITYQGKQNATFFNDVLKASDFEIKGYSTVDLRLGVGAKDDSWQVTAYGRNVFNKVYTTTVTTFLDAQFRFTGRPATYGLSAKFRLK